MDPSSLSSSIPADRLYRYVLSAADQVAIAYVVLIAIVIAIFADRIDVFWLFLLAHAVACGAIFLLARSPGAALSPGGAANLKGAALQPLDSSKPQRRGPVFYLFRFWYPLILIPFTYKELTYLIPRVHPQDLDQQLALIDHRLFGMNPVMLFSRLNIPPLTLALQLSYLCYYVFPVILGVVLWRHRRYAEMHYLIFIVVLGFYLSYIGYILVPAIGPRFFLDGTDVPPFTGSLLLAIRGGLDKAEGLTRDCFPSGHTELTLLVLFCSWRFHRPTFKAILIPAVMLIFATVYLRYHYVIDVIAGAALAFLIMLIADWLFKVMGGRLPARAKA